MPCSHVLCLSCQRSIQPKRCPFCNIEFTSTIPFNDLIEKLNPKQSIQASESELKKRLELLIDQIESISNELKFERENTLNESQTQLEVIKSHIQTRTNEIVKEIYNIRNQLTEESKRVENDLKKKLSDDLTNNKKLIDKKLTEAKKAFQKDEIKTEEKCNNLINSLNEKKTQLNKKLQERQLKEEYYFKSNNLVDIPSDFIGEIAEVVARKNFLPNVPYELMYELNENLEIPEEDSNQNNLENTVIASNTVRKGTKAQQREADEYLKKGLEFQHYGYVEEAIIQHQKAIDIDPDFYEAYESKGVLLIHLKKLTDALKCFDKCIQIDSKLKSGYEGKGICLFKLKKWKETIENYTKLLEISTNSYLAYLHLGICHIELKKFNEAIEYLDEGIKFDPDAELYQTKGYALFCVKRYEDAVKAFKQAKRIDPNETRYDFFFASSYLSLKKYEQTLNVINDMITRDEPDVINFKRELYIFKIEALWGLKKSNEAINLLNTALKDYPRDHILKTFLDNYTNESKSK